MNTLPNLTGSTNLQCCAKTFAGNQYQFRNTSFLKLKFPIGAPMASSRKDYELVSKNETNKMCSKMILQFLSNFEDQMLIFRCFVSNVQSRNFYQILM